MNCNKYKFDYAKHILIKNIISPLYKTYTEYDENFQGIKVERCHKCYVEGYVGLSIPFRINDLEVPEIKCTLFRMGLTEIPSKEVEIMNKLNELDGEYYCDWCQDEQIQEDIDNENTSLDKLISGYSEHDV